MRRISTKKLTIFIVLLIVIASGIYIYTKSQNSVDQKVLSKEFIEFTSASNDCDEFIEKFGDIRLDESAVYAELLRIKYKCSITNKNYEAAIMSAKELENLYSKNPKLPRILDTKTAIFTANELMISKMNEQPTNKREGLQPDGTYLGP